MNCSTLPTGLKNPGSVGVHSSGFVMLVAFEYVPRLQGSGVEAPSRLHLEYPPSALKCPALQRVSRTLPVGQDVPALHVVQRVWPFSGWNVPPPQIRQTALWRSGEKLPGSQIDAFALPAAHA
eukprot:3936824-Prymnesium_polylepis.1